MLPWERIQKQICDHGQNKSNNDIILHKGSPLSFHVKWLVCKIWIDVVQLFIGFNMETYFMDFWIDILFFKCSVLVNYCSGFRWACCFSTVCVSSMPQSWPNKPCYCINCLSPNKTPAAVYPGLSEEQNTLLSNVTHLRCFLWWRLSSESHIWILVYSGERNGHSEPPGHKFRKKWSITFNEHSSTFFFTFHSMSSLNWVDQRFPKT